MQTLSHPCTAVGCGFSFPTSKDLQRHTSRKHVGHAKIKRAQQAAFKCKYCEEPFKSDKSHMYRHIRLTCQKAPSEIILKRQTKTQPRQRKDIHSSTNIDPFPPLQQQAFDAQPLAPPIPQGPPMVVDAQPCQVKDDIIMSHQASPRKGFGSCVANTSPQFTLGQQATSTAKTDAKKRINLVDPFAPVIIEQDIRKSCALPISDHNIVAAQVISQAIKPYNPFIFLQKTQTFSKEIATDPNEAGKHLIAVQCFASESSTKDNDQVTTPLQLVDSLKEQLTIVQQAQLVAAFEEKDKRIAQLEYACQQMETNTIVGSCGDISSKHKAFTDFSVNLDFSDLVSDVPDIRLDMIPHYPAKDKAQQRSSLDQIAPSPSPPINTRVTRYVRSQHLLMRKKYAGRNGKELRSTGVHTVLRRGVLPTNDPLILNAIDKQLDAEYEKLKAEAEVRGEKWAPTRYEQFGARYGQTKASQFTELRRQRDKMMKKLDSSCFLLSEQAKVEHREEAHHRFMCLPPIDEEEPQEKLPESLKNVVFQYRYYHLDNIANQLTFYQTEADRQHMNNTHIRVYFKDTCIDRGLLVQLLQNDTFCRRLGIDKAYTQAFSPRFLSINLRQHNYAYDDEMYAGLPFKRTLFCVYPNKMYADYHCQHSSAQVHARHAGICLIFLRNQDPLVKQFSGKGWTFYPPFRTIHHSTDHKFKSEAEKDRIEWESIVNQKPKIIPSLKRKVSLSELEFMLKRSWIEYLNQQFVEDLENHTTSTVEVHIDWHKQAELNSFQQVSNKGRPLSFSNHEVAMENDLKFAVTDKPLKVLPPLIISSEKKMIIDHTLSNIASARETMRTVPRDFTTAYTRIFKHSSKVAMKAFSELKKSFKIVYSQLLALLKNQRRTFLTKALSDHLEDLIHLTDGADAEPRNGIRKLSLYIGSILTPLTRASIPPKSQCFTYRFTEREDREDSRTYRELKARQRSLQLQRDQHDAGVKLLTKKEYKESQKKEESIRRLLHMKSKKVNGIGRKKSSFQRTKIDTLTKQMRKVNTVATIAKATTEFESSIESILAGYFCDLNNDRERKLKQLRSDSLLIEAIAHCSFQLKDELDGELQAARDRTRSQSGTISAARSKSQQDKLKKLKHEYDNTANAPVSRCKYLLNIIQDRCYSLILMLLSCTVVSVQRSYGFNMHLKSFDISVIQRYQDIQDTVQRCLSQPARRLFSRQQLQKISEPLRDKFMLVNIGLPGIDAKYDHSQLLLKVNSRCSELIRTCQQHENLKKSNASVVQPGSHTTEQQQLRRRNGNPDGGDHDSHSDDDDKDSDRNSESEDGYMNIDHYRCNTTCEYCQQRESRQINLVLLNVITCNTKHNLHALVELNNLIYKRMWLCKVCLLDLEEKKEKFMQKRAAYLEQISTIKEKQSLQAKQPKSFGEVYLNLSSPTTEISQLDKMLFSLFLEANHLDTTHYGYLGFKLLNHQHQFIVRQERRIFFDQEFNAAAESFQRHVMGRRSPVDIHAQQQSVRPIIQMREPPPRITYAQYKLNLLYQDKREQQIEKDNTSGGQILMLSSYNKNARDFPPLRNLVVTYNPSLYLQHVESAERALVHAKMEQRDEDGNFKYPEVMTYYGATQQKIADQLYNDYYMPDLVIDPSVRDMFNNAIGLTAKERELLGTLCPNCKTEKVKYHFEALIALLQPHLWPKGFERATDYDLDRARQWTSLCETCHTKYITKNSIDRPVFNNHCINIRSFTPPEETSFHIDESLIQRAKRKSPLWQRWDDFSMSPKGDTAEIGPPVEKQQQDMHTADGLIEVNKSNLVSHDDDLCVDAVVPEEKKEEDNINTWIQKIAMPTQEVLPSVAVTTQDKLRATNGDTGKQDEEHQIKGTQSDKIVFTQSAYDEIMVNDLAELRALFSQSSNLSCVQEIISISSSPSVKVPNAANALYSQSQRTDTPKRKQVNKRTAKGLMKGQQQLSHFFSQHVPIPKIDPSIMMPIQIYEESKTQQKNTHGQAVATHDLLTVREYTCIIHPTNWDCLGEEAYLNNVVISEYIDMLMLWQLQQNNKSILLMSLQFYAYLQDVRPNWKTKAPELDLAEKCIRGRLKKYKVWNTSGANVLSGMLSFDFIAIPILDVVRQHWLMLVFCTRSHTIYTANPLPGLVIRKINKGKPVGEALEQYTQPAHDLFYSAPFETLLKHLKRKYDHESKAVKAQRLHVPQQQNLFDCGVFLLYYLNEMVRQGTIDALTQEPLAYINELPSEDKRIRIKNALCKGHLIDMEDDISSLRAKGLQTIHYVKCLIQSKLGKT